MNEAWERKKFEEAVFNARFLNSIERVSNPPLNAAGIHHVSLDCPDKAALLRRSPIKPRPYVDPIIDAMWWAWQERAKRDVGDDIPF